MVSTLNEWNKPETRYGDVSIEDEDRVLSIIISNGSSYPAEIAKHLILMTEQISAIVQKLINKGFVKRLLPDQFDPQPLIRNRICEMQSQGILCYGDFCSRSWIIATERGFWYYVDKYSGEHRQASEGYLLHYPNIAMMLRLAEQDMKREVFQDD